jgi:HSP20 family protein
MTRQGASSETRGGQTQSDSSGTGQSTQNRSSSSAGSTSSATGKQSRSGGEAKNSADAERPVATSSEGSAARTGQSATRRQQQRDALSTRGGLRGSLFPTPWELMRRLSDEMAQLVEQATVARTAAAQGSQLARAGSSTNRSGESADALDLVAFTPTTEVIERPVAIVVRVDLPGLRPDDIVVTADDGALTIAGERQQVERKEDDGVVRNEVRYGRFIRSIMLPDGADPERVSASYRDGVLEVTVPLAEQERSRRIEVQSNS